MIGESSPKTTHTRATTTYVSCFSIGRDKLTLQEEGVVYCEVRTAITNGQSPDHPLLYPLTGQMGMESELINSNKSHTSPGGGVWPVQC